MLALQCDVRDHTCVRSCVSECITEMGLPQIVINASSGNIIAPTERLSPNAWATVVDSTLTGTANVITDVGKRLISAHYGELWGVHVSCGCGGYRWGERLRVEVCV